MSLTRSIELGPLSLRARALEDIKSKMTLDNVVGELFLWFTDG